jgi:hypothetical protein
MKVFLLHHVHALPDGREDVKLIGVYSTLERAEEAMRRTLSLPGFRDAPDCFHIDAYGLDQDHWQEGYTTFTGEDGTV